MSKLMELTAEIVQSHASSTPMTTDQLMEELHKVHAFLLSLAGGVPVAPTEVLKPVLTVRQAFKKNEVICMVCGMGGFKTLTRHIKQAHDLKPGQYRKQFGIPSSQSLAAKSYSESRRQMAIDRGLTDVLAKAREARKNSNN